MATAKTPFPIQGKIGNLIYYMREGKQYIRQAPTELKFRKGTPAHGLNRREFGGAAMLAGDIYCNLRQGGDAERLGPIFGPYPQNRITAALKRGAERDRKQLGGRYCYASAFRFLDTARALQGFDLSHPEAHAELVHMQPIGPQHNPTSIKITGLDSAAEAIDAIGSAQLQLRFHIRQTRIQELDINAEDTKWQAKPSASATDRQPSKPTIKAHSAPSDWIPAAIIPREGFTIPIPQWQEDAQYATCIIVEWRAIHATGRRVRNLPHKAIVQIACCHAPAEKWRATETEAQRKNTHSKPQTSSSEVLDIAIADPEAYIRQALQKLLT